MGLRFLVLGLSANLAYGHTVDKRSSSKTQSVHFFLCSFQVQIWSRKTQILGAVKHMQSTERDAGLQALPETQAVRSGPSHGCGLSHSPPSALPKRKAVEGEWLKDLSEIQKAILSIWSGSDGFWNGDGFAYERVERVVWWCQHDRHAYPPTETRFPQGRKKRQHAYCARFAQRETETKQPPSPEKSSYASIASCLFSRSHAGYLGRIHPL